MLDIKTVTASLEGMRIIVETGLCRLQEYDFEKNQWLQKAELGWPLSHVDANEWLRGWNSVDRFAAMSILTEPAQTLR